MNWTDERVERLKKLWEDGLSASQIAAELGGVTRNAVIGKVHRIGLSGRAKPASSPAPRARKPTRPSSPQRPHAPAFRGNTALKPRATPDLDIDLAPEADALPFVDNVVPLGDRCTIMELKEYSCRWPVGDPGKEEFRYCGARSETGKPYCVYHCRVAYQPVIDRRRDRRVAGMR